MSGKGLAAKPEIIRSWNGELNAASSRQVGVDGALRTAVHEWE
ncbi:hypothetical protein XFF6992_390095 [Xanthomonas citri pv. fuscans]|nr:hypothetical protein XFF6992_390095 [Xanthomonas citri pv. fuscans]